MAALVLRAIQASPAQDATFADVANEMISVAQGSPDEYPNYDVFIENQCLSAVIRVLTVLKSSGTLRGTALSNLVSKLLYGAEL